MNKVLLKIPGKVYSKIWSDLLPTRFRHEEAAFLYVHRDTENNAEVFNFVDWLPVPSHGFISRSAIHFELTDEMRAASIKRAHDLHASIVEIHSHRGCGLAQFSASDLWGFKEFVPHVWWRLKGLPYLAIVVTLSSFDGFAWIANPQTPQQLEAICVEKTVFDPTRLSYPRRLKI